MNTLKTQKPSTEPPKTVWNPLAGLTPEQRAEAVAEAEAESQAQTDGKTLVIFPVNE